MRCNKHITYSEAKKEIKERKIRVVASTESQSTGFIQNRRGGANKVEKNRSRAASIMETREAIMQTGETGMKVESEFSSACFDGSPDGVQAAFLLEVINGVASANTMQKKRAIFAKAYSSYYQGNIM